MATQINHNQASHAAAGAGAPKAGQTEVTAASDKKSSSWFDLVFKRELWLGPDMQPLKPRQS